ncbi:MAG: UvrD-helicase domain-containing protein [Gemmatimonadales bacterium]
MTLALNAAQREAVEHAAGPLLVLAGAGSGKTRVLTARIAWLMAERGLHANQIFAVTFTNRAASEMRHRVAALLGREPSGLWIGTFHSLAGRLLRREAPLLGFTSQYTIYDQDDRVTLIRRLLDRRGYATKQFSPQLIQSIISNAKNRLVSAEELAAVADDRLTKVAAEIYQDLGQALLQANAMDFDDLLLHPLTVFRQHPDRLALWQRRFQAVLVDEFQDTNRAQYLMVRSLAGQHRELFAVGDDDQSIYGWRGAEVRNILDLQRDFTGTHIVRLEENYRSTQMILDAANAVIAENADRLGKTLFTKRPGGDAIAVVGMADERDEAEWVARELKERSTIDHYAWSDFAVLFRTNSQSRAFEDAFRRLSMPYQVVGTVSFYNRREVKDLLAYLRLLVNPADDESFLRAVSVPKRGIGDGALAAVQEVASAWRKSLAATAVVADRLTGMRPQARTALMEFAAMLETIRSSLAGQQPAAVLEHVVERIDYEGYLMAEGPEGMDRLENVRELIAGAADWSEEVEDADDETTPLERFLASAALTTSTENVGGDPHGIKLMTVHTAKGLEWPVVVVAGLEDGLFPLSRSLESPGGPEEERRLAYVAVTRARDRLYLTWARMRRRAGQLMPSIASRFLESLPPGVVDERRSNSRFAPDLRPGGKRFSRMPAMPAWDAPAAVAAPAVETESQVQPRYVKGERVRHRRFGAGTIMGLDGRGRDLKVTVSFDDEEVGTKQLLVAYAGLERDDWESA